MQTKRPSIEVLWFEVKHFAGTTLFLTPEVTMLWICIATCLQFSEVETCFSVYFTLDGTLNAVTEYHAVLKQPNNC